jgi:hypothetical protein
MPILLSLVSGGAFDATMPFMNAEPILHSGGHAENIDKSGSIRGLIVEESLIGRARLGAFSKKSTKLCKTTLLSASCRSEKRSRSRCKSHQETLQEAVLARPLG